MTGVPSPEFVTWLRDRGMKSPWDTERTGVEWALSRKHSRPGWMEEEVWERQKDNVKNYKILKHFTEFVLIAYNDFA